MGGASSRTPESKFYPAFAAQLHSLDGKTVVITGCTSGTGLVAAKLAAYKGAHVFMLNRPSKRAEAAFAAVQGSASSNGKATSIACDLSDFDSVRKAAGEIKAAASTVDVLCNNAGVFKFPDQATKDGYDIQMQTNHLSHVLLTRELLPLLEAAAEGSSGEARVVNHSSIARTSIQKLERQYFGKNGGNLGGDGYGSFMNGPRWRRYQQTKLANATFTHALARELSASGSKVKAVVAAPGISTTSIFDNATSTGASFADKAFETLLMYTAAHSCEDGTVPLLTCMFDPSVKSGEFYEPGNSCYGQAVKKELEPHCISAENEAVMLEPSCAAVGGFPLFDDLLPRAN